MDACSPPGPGSQLTTMEMRKRYKDEIAWAIKRPRTLLPEDRAGSAFAVWGDGANVA